MVRCWAVLPGLRPAKLPRWAPPIAGMGVESIASTGIKTSLCCPYGGQIGKRSRSSGQWPFLKLNPAQLAADMQKDSRAAMLKVLDSLAKCVAKTGIRHECPVRERVFKR
ncbi:hypothetical protein KCP75_03700 [Salmonella enterica subsp. enterica]|nr:hypothetical protein KCP75_03700 [Salmonella enterica subsp. enterica]